MTVKRRCFGCRAVLCSGGEAVKKSVCIGILCVLDESKVHSQIKNVKKYKVGKKVSFKTPSGDLLLKLSEAPVKELLVGEAPGIPALKLAEEGTGAQLCYPIIVRLQGSKNMRISARWTIFNANTNK